MGGPAQWSAGFNSVAAVSADVAWVVGGYGVILKTTDGGASWSPQYSGTNSHLYDIEAVDSNVAWAVGQNGVILKTADGGTNWIQQNSNTNLTLYAISVVDANVAWAVGDGGSNAVILRTTDGGAYWWNQWATSPCTMRDISALDANTAWAVGSITRQVGNPAFPQYETRGLIMKTTTGGLIWFHQYESSPSVGINSISAVDVNTAWAAGSNLPLLKTSDGGFSWIPKSPAYYLGSVTALSANDVWVSYSGNLFHSTDDGASWNPSYPGITGLQDIDIVDASTIWAVASENMARTVNGGSDWAVLDVGVKNAFMGVSALDVYNAWMVGMDIGFCNILKTDVGPVYIRQTHQIWDVSAVNSNVAWAAGGNGTITKTTDGGTTWNVQGSGTASTLFGIEAVDPQTAWSVGAGGIVLKTLNGGSSWTAQASGTTLWLWDISAVDGSTAWTVGGDGTILKTTNGGTNWVPQASGVSGTLLGVSAVDANTAWAVGADGIILKTSDGGNVWTVQDSGTYQWLWGIAAVDADTAWVVGHGGTILKTEDSGSTWIQEDSGTTAHLYAVSALDGKTARAVGADGANLWTADWDRWVEQYRGEHNEEIPRIDAVDETTAWAVNSDNDLLRISDGETWEKITGKEFVAVSALDAETAWAICTDYTIFSTDNGGQTWDDHSSETVYGASHIFCVNDDIIWAAGYTGIFRTLDGGQIWEEIDHGTAATQCGTIEALDENTIFIRTTVPTGEMGVWNHGILRTDDGGDTWSLSVLPPLSTDPLYGYTGFFVVDAQTIWVTGYHGTIVKTTDGGATWTRQESGTDEVLWDIDGEGIAAWAVGDNGIILRTTDGGESWVVQYAEYNLDYMPVDAVDANTAWAGGTDYYGFIKKTADWNGEAPSITSISPQTAQTGVEVTIEGSDFYEYRGSSCVMFGCAKATAYTSWSDGQVVCTVPQGASGEVEVRVVRSGLVSNGVSFNAEATYPTLTSINPTQGMQNTTVYANLAGSNFQAGATARLERGAIVIQASEVNVASDTQISCTFNIGGQEAGAYDVVVSNPDGQEARLSGGFTITSACGIGASIGMLMLGVALGLLSLAGSTRLFKRKR